MLETWHILERLPHIWNASMMRMDTVHLPAVWEIGVLVPYQWAAAALFSSLAKNGPLGSFSAARFGLRESLFMNHDRHETTGSWGGLFYQRLWRAILVYLPWSNHQWHEVPRWSCAKGCSVTGKGASIVSQIFL
jgi:hypothetical protein